jgi:hypothetical protein
MRAHAKPPERCSVIQSDVRVASRGLGRSCPRWSWDFLPYWRKVVPLVLGVLFATAWSVLAVALIFALYSSPLRCPPAMGCEAPETTACGGLGTRSGHARDLEHFIVSHHGQIEWGAVKLPMTREARVFHLLDMIDSQMAIMNTAFDHGTDGNGFTTFVPALRTALWTGHC